MVWQKNPLSSLDSFDDHQKRNEENHTPQKNAPTNMHLLCRKPEVFSSFSGSGVEFFHCFWKAILILGWSFHLVNGLLRGLLPLFITRSTRSFGGRNRYIMGLSWLLTTYTDPSWNDAPSIAGCDRPLSPPPKVKFSVLLHPHSDGSVHLRQKNAEPTAFHHAAKKGSRRSLVFQAIICLGDANLLVSVKGKDVFLWLELNDSEIDSVRRYEQEMQLLQNWRL